MTSRPVGQEGHCLLVIIKKKFMWHECYSSIDIIFSAPSSPLLRCASCLSFSIATKEVVEH